MQTREVRGGSLVPLGVLVVIAAAGLGFLILHPEGLRNRHSDLVSQALATQQILHDSWMSGLGIPLWRSDQMSGMPALTNPQAAYTHPLHLLFAIVEPARVVGLVIWLEVLLGAIGAYWTATVLGLSPPARLVTSVAVLFSFKTVLAVYAGWLPVLAAIAALPFLFAAALTIFQRPRLASVLAGGAAGTLALHAGHPQLVYYAVVFIALWAVTVCVQLAAARDPRAWNVPAMFASAAVLAVGVSAYRWMPIADELSLVTRHAADRAFFFGNTPFTAWGLLTIFKPEFFGTPLDGSLAEGWEYILYLGVVPTALALFGFAAGRRRPHLTALRIALVLSAVLAIDSPVLRVVADVVPGYTLFRMPARVLFLTALFGYCLAGVGAEELLARVPVRWRQGTVVLLVAAISVEGSYWARRYLRTDSPVAVPLEAAYHEALRSAGPARVASLSTSTPQPGAAAALGLQLVTGYDPFNFRHYETYMDLLRFGHPLVPRPQVWITIDTIARWDLLDALDVSRLVATSPQSALPPGWTPAGAFDDQPQFRIYEGVARGPVYVYARSPAPSRAFFVSSVEAVPDEPAMIAAVQHTNVRDAAVAIGVPGGVSQAGPDDRIEIVRSTGGVLDLRVRNSERRFVVVSEVWHPGWRATVDGRPATLARTDIALQGLWLEPGVHDVRLRFWPPGLSAGLWISGATAAAFLGGLVLTWRRRRVS